MNQTQEAKVVLLLTELTTRAVPESPAQEHCLRGLLKMHTPELLSWNLLSKMEASVFLISSPVVVYASESWC